jgi:hypothetical protein
VFAAVATVLLVDPAGSPVAVYSNLIAAGDKHGDHKGILRGFTAVLSSNVSRSGYICYMPRVTNRPNERCVV